MANTQWITKRREGVSQILVDSLQKLGTSVRDSANDLSRQSTATATAGRSVATQVSLSEHTASGKQPSNVLSPHRECVVPKLDIASLLPGGCTGEGTNCYYVCVICGDAKQTSPYSDMEAISVLSAKNSHTSNPPSKEVKTNGLDKEVDTSHYILHNLNLEGPPSVQENDVLEDESSKREEKLSVLRISCADPRDLVRERTEMRNSAKLKERKKPGPESRSNACQVNFLTDTSTREECMTPPFTIAKKKDSENGSETPLTQCENEKKSDKHIESDLLPAIHPKQSISLSEADKDRRQSFGFTMKDIMKHEEIQGMQHSLHQQGSKSSTPSRLRKLFGRSRTREKAHEHYYL